MLKNYKFEEKEDLVTFLGNNYRSKITNSEFSKILDEYSQPTHDLMKKMEV